MRIPMGMRVDQGLNNYQSYQSVFFFFFGGGGGGVGGGSWWGVVLITTVVTWAPKPYSNSQGLGS